KTVSIKPKLLSFFKNILDIQHFELEDARLKFSSIEDPVIIKKISGQSKLNAMKVPQCVDIQELAGVYGSQTVKGNGKLNIKDQEIHELKVDLVVGDHKLEIGPDLTTPKNFLWKLKSSIGKNTALNSNGSFLIS